jgi:hypothetical protein
LRTEGLRALPADIPVLMLLKRLEECSMRIPPKKPLAESLGRAPGWAEGMDAFSWILVTVASDGR